MNLDKSEILGYLETLSLPPPTPNFNHTPFKDLTIKNSVKILEVYFTYDRCLRRKLNFDEITKTIKDKLRIGNERILLSLAEFNWSKHLLSPLSYTVLA